MMETPTEPLFKAQVDMRRSLRRHVLLPCELVSHGNDEPTRLWIGDLSPYGAWIDTRMPLHPGAEVVMCFSPPGERDREVMAFARVTRAVTGRLRSHRGPIGMGLELLDLSFDERMRIAHGLRGIPPRLHKSLHN